MSFARVLVLLAALLSLAGCAPPATFRSLAPEPASGEERRILVTFVDHAIERDFPGHVLDRYQSSGQYANSSWSERFAQELAEGYAMRFVAAWPVTVLGVACVVYEVPPPQAVDEVLATLAKDKRVESAQKMRTFRSLGRKQSATDGYSDPYYRLQTDLAAMRIAAAHRLATGRGVRVAVIDSGVDGSHPDLAGQVAKAENLAQSDAEESIADIHGTAVAGVIAAHSHNGVGIVGIAPDAELYALRACRPEKPGAAEAVCNSFTLALGLNEALRLNADIVNLSLTGPEDPLLARLIRVALERGVLVVAADDGAAGAFPAHMDQVIGVRSARPGVPEEGLAAPGTRILTTLPNGAYDFMTGSSFAAPHVAGVLALMREIEPDLDSRQALEILRLAADDRGRNPAGVLDACLALARLKGEGNCPAQ